MTSASPFISSLTSTARKFGVESSRSRFPRRPEAVTFRQAQTSAASAFLERSSTSIAASLYDVLGIRTTATCLEIKQAYRRLARVSHPDIASSGADDFIRIHSAYSTLSDPVKRSNYDQAMLPSFEMDSASLGYSRSSTSRRWETDQCW